MPLFGPPDVKKLEAKRKVKGLIKALKHRGFQVDAVKALGKIKDSRAVEPLVAALNESSWPLRRAAIEALGEIGDVRAVELYKSGKSMLTTLCADALGNIGDAGAVEPLIATLKDKTFTRPQTQIASMPSSSNTIGVAVAEALGKIGHRRAIRQLMTTLEDKNNCRDVRRAAAWSLGEIGNPRAIELLGKILLDKKEDKYLRERVVRALGRFGKPALKAISTGIADSDENVQKATMEVIVALRNKS